MNAVSATVDNQLTSAQIRAMSHEQIFNLDENDLRVVVCQGLRIDRTEDDIYAALGSDARLMAERDSEEHDVFKGDGHYYAEKLYMCADNTWVVEGEGGGLSHWAHYDETERSSSYGSGVCDLNVMNVEYWVPRICRYAYLECQSKETECA